MRARELPCRDSPSRLRVAGLHCRLHAGHGQYKACMTHDNRDARTTSSATAASTTAMVHTGHRSCRDLFERRRLRVRQCFAFGCFGHEQRAGTSQPVVSAILPLAGNSEGHATRDRPGPGARSRALSNRPTVPANMGIKRAPWRCRQRGPEHPGSGVAPRQGPGYRDNVAGRAPRLGTRSKNKACGSLFVPVRRCSVPLAAHGSTTSGWHRNRESSGHTRRGSR